MNPQRFFRTLCVLPMLCLLLSCDRESAAWDDAASSNNIVSYEEYLSNHSDGGHAQEARSRIASLEVQIAGDDAFRLNTVASYEKYLNDYPSSMRAGEVNARLESLLWANAKDTGSVNDFLDFIERYPDGPHTEQATTLLSTMQAEDMWESARQVDSAAAYERYIESWPNGGHVAEARRIILIRTGFAIPSIRAASSTMRFMRRQGGQLTKDDIGGRGGVQSTGEMLMKPDQQFAGSIILARGYEPINLDSVPRRAIRGRVMFRSYSDGTIAFVTPHEDDRLYYEITSTMRTTEILPNAVGSIYCFEGRIAGIAPGIIIEGDPDQSKNVHSVSDAIGPLPTIDGDSDGPLCFRLDASRGLVYVGGSGTVITPDSEVRLPLKE